jgi:hypothetical protein
MSNLEQTPAEAGEGPLHVSLTTGLFGGALAYMSIEMAQEGVVEPKYIVGYSLAALAVLGVSGLSWREYWSQR